MDASQLIAAAISGLLSGAVFLVIFKLHQRREARLKRTTGQTDAWVR